METLKDRKQKYIDDYKYQLWVAEIDYDTLQKILPDMQNARDLMQSEVDSCDKRIDELSKDPSREARENRKKVEEKKKSWEKKLDFQNIQIDGGKVEDKYMAGAIEKGEALETTIKNLEIIIGIAEKHK